MELNQPYYRKEKDEWLLYVHDFQQASKDTLGIFVDGPAKLHGRFKNEEKLQ